MKDKPTYEQYYPNGNIEYQAWYLKNNYKLHRSNGLPAQIWYNKNGNIKHQEWWKNGKHLSPKEVLQRQYKLFNKVMDSINKKGIKL